MLGGGHQSINGAWGVDLDVPKVNSRGSAQDYDCLIEELEMRLFVLRETMCNQYRDDPAKLMYCHYFVKQMGTTKHMEVFAQKNVAYSVPVDFLVQICETATCEGPTNTHSIYRPTEESEG